MNTVKTLGLGIATAVASTVGLSSCVTCTKFEAEWIDKNQKEIVKSGVSAEEFSQMLEKNYAIDSWSEECKAWEDISDSIKNKNFFMLGEAAAADSLEKINIFEKKQAFEAGKAFAIDSIAHAAKAIK